MPLSIKSLRRSVVAGGATLLLVLAVFLGLARLHGRGFHFDLPGRLGVDISQTANGFTYSQSQKGHTLFTIHASKVVQYKGDQAELHDVTITLYGPEGSGRTDKIYGSDFSYDRKAGIAHAKGLVRIDISSPQSAATTPQAGTSNVVHVDTSDLVFNQATGEATTTERVDFALARAGGSAVGANYNPRSGMLVLDREVTVSTQEGGEGPPTVVHAEHAQLFRDAHQVFLLKPDTTYGDRHSSADEATVGFRPDGSAAKIAARGHVRLSTEDGAEVNASTAIIDLDDHSQPSVAELGRGVTYHSVTNGQTMQGTAVSGTLNFATARRTGAPAVQHTEQVLHHAQFRDAVSFVMQQGSFAGDAHGSSTREMRASKMDVDFAPGVNGRTEAQHLLAVGGAGIKLHDVPAKAPPKTTSIAGDQLLATLANGRELKLLDGQGHTEIVDTAPNGATSTSTGDTLHVTFAAAGAPRRPGEAGSSAQVDTVLQQGNVSMTQTPALQTPAPDTKTGAAPSPLHATATCAEYHAADQVLHLTGDPHLRNDTVALAADKVDYHRDTGDATAMGNVKSTYAEQPGAKASGPTLGGDGPVHIIADHAQLTRDSNLSVFYGAPGAPARVWQGADAVAAPVLELGRDPQTLDAHGLPGNRKPAVQATLGSKPTPPNPAQPSSPTQPQRLAATTRLSSQTLHYSDGDRRADLAGAVTAEQPSGVVHADQVQIFLTPADKGTASALDHMVALGHVIITQPGRRGTGDRLLYTAKDQRYTLTGSPQQPPRVVDADKGTTTGAALIFKGADDSVEVSSQANPSGSLPSPTANTGYHARTVTDTRSPR